MRTSNPIAAPFPVVLTMACAVSAAMAAQAPPRTPAEDQEVARSRSLTICLATAADDSPVYPTTLFLEGVRSVSCTFVIPPDVDATKVTSKWIAADVGDAAPSETVMATNEFTKATEERTGRFRYSQDNPLPKGEYRLEVLLDDEPWETAMFRVADPPRHPPIESAAELIPIEASEWLSYDMTIWGPGLVQQRPGAASVPADHKFRHHLLSLVRETDERGSPVHYYVNGEHAFTIWKKALDNGIGITASQSVGDSIASYDPPAILCPFPLETYMSWRETREAGEHGPAEISDNELWGPLPLLDERGHGFVLLMRKEHEGAAATTTELHIVPGTGIVRQKRIDARNKKLVEAHDWLLEPRLEIVSNDELRGRFGRLVVAANSETWTSVYAAAKPIERIHRQGGDVKLELLPGQYFAEVNNVRVGPFEITSRHDTTIRCGALQVHASDTTWSSLYQAGSNDRLQRFGGSKEFTLPIGPYEIEVAGQREVVIVRHEQTTDF